MIEIGFFTDDPDGKIPPDLTPEELVEVLWILEKTPRKKALARVAPIWERHDWPMPKFVRQILGDPKGERQGLRFRIRTLANSDSDQGRALVKALLDRGYPVRGEVSRG